MVKYDLWIDVSNTPQVHIARTVIESLKNRKIFITGFRRGEVYSLFKLYNINGNIFGSDSSNSLLKSLSFAFRTFRLLFQAPRAKCLFSVENAMPIPASTTRRMKSILLLDNDLKFDKDKPVFQKIESFLKKYATTILVPEVSKDEFEKYIENLDPFPGFKEHVYLADFKPSKKFLDEIPYKEYVILRPESLSSLYVMKKKSLVPELIRLFSKNNINVVYLPRNKEEKELAPPTNNVYIPRKALDGLNLIYYSQATITGSGTMSREAALMGVPAVSFFPGKKLLAVDKSLIKTGKIFHSREPREIVDYVISMLGKKKQESFKAEQERARKAKKYLLNKIGECIESI